MCLPYDGHRQYEDFRAYPGYLTVAAAERTLGAVWRPLEANVSETKQLPRRDARSRTRTRINESERVSAHARKHTDPPPPSSNLFVVLLDVMDFYREKEKTFSLSRHT